MAGIVVDAWSDVICPWCWIGDLHLEKALAYFPHRDQVEVRHRSYLLMPGVPQQPVLPMMQHKTGRDEKAVRGMFAQVEALARAEGLEYDIARTVAGDTTDVHRVIQFANTKGLGERAFKRFYRAHFIEGLSIFNHESLRQLAEEAGLDEDEVSGVLASDGFRREVSNDYEAAQSLRVQGVPFYKIGNYAVSGAQPVGTFAEALRKAWSERTPSVDADEPAAPVCGPDGCY